MASIRDLTGLAQRHRRPRIASRSNACSTAWKCTRARAERVLYQADQIAGQVADILVRSRAEIERSVTNIRDATDWANRLVQKIYANPIVAQPVLQADRTKTCGCRRVYDTALVFTKGAQELQ